MNFDKAYKLAVLVLLLVITVFIVRASIELVDYLQAGRSAWTAPWLNVINRGPVQ